VRKGAWRNARGKDFVKQMLLVDVTKKGRGRGVSSGPTENKSRVDKGEGKELGKSVHKERGNYRFMEKVSFSTVQKKRKGR